MTIVVQVLLLFMIIAALVAIWTEDLLSSVIAVGAVGFGCSVTFLMLRAPDVAITQTVVEVLMLVLLIRATLGRDVKTRTGPRDLPSTVAAGALLVLFAVAAVVAVSTLPEFGDAAFVRSAGAPAAEYVEKGLEETGCGNIVASVLLDYRGYDTLGEVTVLFAAVLGAVTVLRRKSRTGGAP